uniref:Uncharacterized protein n=1 Tax=Clandestinovirus TaxID=2831644 RepID=A0A8F8PQW6_9VIRU|nr:hypothetical protein KOM_12_250 [Clandestinovirus]
MGVDFTLLKGLGFLVPISCLPKDEDVMCEFRDAVYEDDTVDFSSQDNYGTRGQDFTPYAFINFKDETTTVYDGKIGGTPFSLILFGVYTETNIIKGGAVKPFAICCQEECNLDDEAAQVKTKIIEAVKSINEEIAKQVEVNGLFGEWLFSYFS